MRILILALLVVPCILAQPAAVQRSTFSDAGNANLLGQTIGTNDLISVSVYDAPEFTRTVRVGEDGQITLPMMKHAIAAAGLMPHELEVRIAEALRTEDLLKEPDVIVTVAEYQSRPISVSGAVRTPVIFQAIGKVHLMEAINRAGGIAPEAGPEAIIKQASGGNNGLLLRIPLKPLLDASDPKLDILLDGGDEVRVPPLPVAGRVFVLGNVKAAGAFPIQDKTDATVLGMLTLAGGLAAPAPNEAYIIRLDDGAQSKHQIPVPLKDIIASKAADVPLLAHDVLYIPTNKKHDTLLALEKLLQVATSGVVISNVAR